MRNEGATDKTQKRHELHSDTKKLQPESLKSFDYVRLGASFNYLLVWI